MENSEKYAQEAYRQTHLEDLQKKKTAFELKI